MRAAFVPHRQDSPIARMQRQLYPWEPHPLAAAYALRQRVSGFGALGADLVGGAKAGISAGTTAAAAASYAGSTIGVIGAGAAAGSVVPIIGTAIGAIVALVASGVFNHKVDPEVGNFNNAMALVRAQGPQAVLGIQDKYLVLAGLFDLLPGQIKGNIPIYKKYGRMGEQKFVTDMCNLIQQAADQGIITANDTVQSVYDKVVGPWIAGFGFGPMQDSNSDLINTLILGLIGEYVSGQFKNRWYARGGDFAFNNLPLFKLPAQSAVTPTASGTPVPTTSPGAGTPTAQGVVPPGFTQVSTSPTGQPLYGQAGDPHVYVFSGGQLVTYNPSATPSSPQTSAVPVPAGFTLVGAANNLPAYQGVDGYYYSWSGTVMSPLTGLLQTNTGGLLTVQSGAPVIANAPGALPSLTTNTQAGVSPYASSYAPYTPPASGIPTIAPGNAPAQPAAQPIAAGIDTSGLPSWVSWGAVAGVLGLMLMTARPVPARPRPARARPRSR